MKPIGPRRPGAFFRNRGIRCLLSDSTIVSGSAAGPHVRPSRTALSVVQSQRRACRCRHWATSSQSPHQRGAARPSPPTIPASLSRRWDHLLRQPKSEVELQRAPGCRLPVPPEYPPIRGTGVGWGHCGASASVVHVIHRNGDPSRRNAGSPARRSRCSLPPRRRRCPIRAGRQASTTWTQHGTVAALQCCHGLIKP